MLAVINVANYCIMLNQIVSVQYSMGDCKVSLTNGTKLTLEYDARDQFEKQFEALTAPKPESIVPSATPPPADAEDRQLAAIARGIAERIEVYELPLSGTLAFAYKRGNAKYAAKLNTPDGDPLMEALRQLALWKAGQQVAEAEAAPVDALVVAQARIAELEAEVARLQEERDSAVREANKRAFLLREIEFYTDPKNRKDGEVLPHMLNSIHARIGYTTLSTSVPESEATDA